MTLSIRIGLLAIILLTLSCSDNNPAQSIQQSAPPPSQLALRPVNSCDELKQHFIDNWVENLLAGQRFTSPLFDQPLGAPSETVSTSGASADALASAAAIPDDVSQTNVQEAGVDEADNVKADSRGNLYIAQHDKLVIADAFPASSMSILSTLELGGYVSGIYLSEADNIIVALVTPIITSLPVSAAADMMTTYTPWQSKTDLVLVDVSDLQNPVIDRRIRVDGNLVSSRRIDSRIVLVQSYYLTPLWHLLNDDLNNLLARFREAYQADDQSSLDDLRTQIRQHVVSALSVDNMQALLPSWQVLVNGAAQDSSLLDCAAVYTPDIQLDHNQLLTVTSIDLASNDVQQIAANGSGWITYASRNDLFIVQSGNNWWWDRDQQQQSAIHHFSFTDNSPSYVSTGLVKGFVNDSFSLSYYQDRLRVATTQSLWNLSDRSDMRSTNHLFVLADNASQGMDIVGAVENYGDNERIFSARLLDDRGFVVTFRRIDPLFTFDLSDPTQPQLIGELEIPGFSTYMHPLGDTHLLTIGRDGTAAGASNQIAVKLFDVSELANPLLVDSYTPSLGDGYSWSQANWDHHAFTYYAPQKMLSIPLSSFNSISNDYFMGLLVLNVDTVAGLSLAGKIDHQDLLPATNCSASEPFCDRFYHRWLAQPTRTVFMSENTDSYLYSLSNIGLKSASTTALDLTLDSLLLPSPQGFYGIYF